MAKISAGGDRTEYRWANARGRALVLTRQGRLLGKDYGRDRYRLLGRNVGFEEAERRPQAQHLIVWPSWWQPPPRR